LRDLVGRVGLSLRLLALGAPAASALLGLLPRRRRRPFGPPPPADYVDLLLLIAARSVWPLALDFCKFLGCKKISVRRLDIFDPSADKRRMLASSLRDDEGMRSRLVRNWCR
jgi:hypothetical protein